MSPHPFACSAEIFSARKNIPVARCVPTSRGTKKVPLVSGINPNLEKLSTKLADSAAIVRSQAKARLAPAPAAIPFTAQITGFSRVRMARMIGLKLARTTSEISGMGPSPTGSTSWRS